MNLRVEPIGCLDHRLTPLIGVIGTRFLALHPHLHLAELLDEARKARIHRELQALFENLADARCKAAGCNCNAHRSGFGDRRHRDESVLRLIDAAEQKFVPVGKRAQTRRQRFILRRRDHEVRPRDVFVAYACGVLNPTHVRTRLT